MPSNITQHIQCHMSHPILISMQRHIDTTCMDIPHIHKEPADFIAPCGQLNHHWSFLSLLKRITCARTWLLMPQKLFSSSKSECSKHVWQRSRLFKPLLRLIFLMLQDFLLLLQGGREGISFFLYAERLHPPKASPGTFQTSSFRVILS